MKEIIAIIRPSRAKLTKQRLAEKGFMAYTEERVMGRGKQKGLRYSSLRNTAASLSDEKHEEAEVSFLPKRMLMLFVDNEDVDQAIDVLMEANKTGEIGDGKIFICQMEDAVRIRTGEKGNTALS